MWRVIFTMGLLVGIACPNFVKASELLETELAIRPFEENSTDLFTILDIHIKARHAFEARDYELASRHYALLVKYDPSFTEAVIGLAKTEIALGRYQRADKTLSKLSDTSDEVLVLKALSQAKISNLDDAEEVLLNALMHHEDARLSNLLGEVLLKKGQLEEAKKAFLKAETIGQRQGLLSNNLGMIAFHQGDLDEAIIQFSRAVEVAPDVVRYDNNRRLALLLKTSYVMALQNLTPKRSVNLLNDAAIIADKKGEGDLSDLFLKQVEIINPSFAPVP